MYVEHARACEHRLMQNLNINKLILRINNKNIKIIQYVVKSRP